MFMAPTTQDAPMCRFNLLSLKKNKKKLVDSPKDTEPQIVVLDDSFDQPKHLITSKRGNWKKISGSPIIVIDDSFENKNDDSIFKSPQPYEVKDDTSKRKNQRDLSITSETRRLKVHSTPESRPSRGGWSPAQDIVCASPKFLTPSTSRDVANESVDECSMQDVNEAHRNILDELYGDVWKSIPTLFRKKHKKSVELEGITKTLQFDEDSDKENDNLFDGVRKTYNDDNTSTPKPKPERKRKLFSEKTAETPEIRRLKKELLNFYDDKPKKKEKVREPSQTEKKPRPKKETEKERRPQSEKNREKVKRPAVEKREEGSKNVRRALLPENGLNVQKLSFMASLAENVPSWRCDPVALDLRNNFRTKRDQLTQRLFRDFNRLVFEDRLEPDMPIIWDSKLRTTAGTATNRLIKTADLTKVRVSSIKLSTKVIDTAERLRDTLVHEMCHSATWVIDNELRDGHGPLWKKWARKALKVLPELVEISRCHDLQIHFKYSYKCCQCGYTINRHSKSIDLTKKCCGYCRGTFELVINKKTKEGVVLSTPAKTTGKAANDFALYVKEHYKDLKKGRSHAEVMRSLAERYAQKKKKESATT